MKRRNRMLVSLLVAGGVASCANQPERDPSRPAEAPKSLSQRLNEQNGYKQDDQGNWVPMSDKRSSFERVGASPYFRGERNEKEYRTGEYKKSSWWGKKDFRTSEWQGNRNAEGFQTTARQESRKAREAGMRSGMTDRYPSDEFVTGTARESQQRGIENTTDAETELRRRSYRAPDVLDWSQQRRLSREETKSLLGR